MCLTSSSFLHDSKDSETEAKSTHGECPPDRREATQLAKKESKEERKEKEKKSWNCWKLPGCDSN